MVRPSSSFAPNDPYIIAFICPCIVNAAPISRSGRLLSLQLVLGRLQCLWVTYLRWWWRPRKMRSVGRSCSVINIDVIHSLRAGMLLTRWSPRCRCSFVSWLLLGVYEPTDMNSTDSTDRFVYTLLNRVRLQ